MTPNLGSKYPKCVLTQIRLFLFISDVFLCISTIIFSKNMKLPNGRFLENLDSTVSTGHPEQKNIIFRIFPRTKLVIIHGKIAKKQSHLAKFGCVSGAISIFQNLPSGNFMFLLNIIVDMHRNTSEMNKNHLIWVRTHFGYFDPRFGVIIWLF